MYATIAEGVGWYLEGHEDQVSLCVVGKATYYVATPTHLALRLSPDIIDAIGAAHAAGQFPHQAGIPASFDAACRDVTSNAVIDFDLAITQPPEEKEKKSDDGRDRRGD